MSYEFPKFFHLGCLKLVFQKFLLTLKMWDLMAENLLSLTLALLLQLDR